MAGRAVGTTRPADFLADAGWKVRELKEPGNLASASGAGRTRCNRATGAARPPVAVRAEVVTEDEYGHCGECRVVSAERSVRIENWGASRLRRAELGVFASSTAWKRSGTTRTWP